jgi:anti-sigma B factor antagonist
MPIDEEPLSVTERRVGDVTILDLKGKVVLCYGEPIHDKVTALIEEGRTKVLVNFSELSYFDVTALGELVRCHISLSRKGGCLKFLRPSKRIQRLVEATKLSNVFEIHENEKEAVDSF